jgi:hypothetical protein
MKNTTELPHNISNFRLKLEKLFDHSIVKGLGLFALSTIFYFCTDFNINVETKSPIRLLNDVLSAVTNQNPDSGDLSRIGGTFGAMLATGYMVSGETFKFILGQENKRLGFKAVPKKWKDHTVIFDPDRVLIDSFLKKRNEKGNLDRLVWAHNSDALVEGRLQNFPDKSDLRLWHANCGLDIWASDSEFLKRMNPKKAGKLIIPLWNRDQVLYTELQGGNSLITPEQAALIARTWQKLGGKEIIIIASKTTKVKSPSIEEPIDLIEYFKLQDIKNIKVQCAEDIVLQESKLFDKIISDLSEVNNALTKDFSDKTSTNIRVGVYSSTDAKSISDGKLFLHSNPKTQVTVFIEDPDNKKEAEDAELTPIVIPDLIAQKLYSMI